MCGRYYVDDDTAREIEKIVRQVDEQMSRVKAGDICPSGTAPVLMTDGEQISVRFQKWGFPGFDRNHSGRADDSGKLLINARAESAMEKPTFRDKILRHRIVIPAASFYEWNSRKEKNTFTRCDSDVLFMAGIYGKYEDVDRFVILTTAANESMQPVHDRMPLILERGEMEEWLWDDRRAMEILQKEPVRLERKTEYEQLSLF